MGQAKQRGSFEERKRQSIARQKEEAQERYKGMRIGVGSAIDKEKKKLIRRHNIPPMVLYASMAALMSNDILRKHFK
jgi:hypothetical protein